MKDEIKEILGKLKDNIPIEEYRSEGTSDGLTHYEEDKDSWQYKLLDYITNLKEENEHLRTELDTYKNAVYKIRSYINAYSPYFLQTQEENNQTIAKIIHEELDGGNEE